jgi:isovaleryl-CoA dehydrogenase
MIREAANNAAAAAMHEVYGGTALTDEYPCKKLKAYVDRLTVGEGTENVQRIPIAEDTLGIKDANRHPVRNRARGGG